MDGRWQLCGDFNRIGCCDTSDFIVVALELYTQFKRRVFFFLSVCVAFNFIYIHFKNTVFGWG